MMDAAEAADRPNDETTDDPPNSPAMFYTATVPGLTQVQADAIKA